jgi:hypothetical protein
MTELDDFIDEMLGLAGGLGYVPTKFLAMRESLGTQGAIERLVVTGDIQSGFKRLHSLGLLDYTIEAAVVRFPHIFTNAQIRAAAEWRLAQARAGGRKRKK